MVKTTGEGLIGDEFITPTATESEEHDIIVTSEKGQNGIRHPKIAPFLSQDPKTTKDRKHLDRRALGWDKAEEN